jgi:hypothetical protein
MLVLSLFGIVILPREIENAASVIVDENFEIDQKNEPLAPIAITSVTELQNMKNNLSADYYLANDIDASDTKDWSAGGFDPIGDSTNKFEGSFNGRGYNITDLYIDRPAKNYVGLFGNIETKKSISNVSLKNIYVKGQDNVGGLVGYNAGNIFNCNVQGIVESDDDYLGGFGGEHAQGKIFNCFANCTVIGSVTDTDYIGGLFGYAVSGLINHCYTEGSVSGYCENGGLIGSASKTLTINNSYSTCSVTGSSDYTAGLVGDNYATIYNSYATGTVMGGYANGGLVGWNAGIINRSYATGTVTGTLDSTGGFVGFQSGSPITNCYSTGTVIGPDKSGGFVGHLWDNTIENSYSTGAVSGSTHVGGFVGMISTGSTNNCFWDNETSGQTKSDAGTGKYTAEMMKSATFTGASWNFVKIWGIVEDETYPFLWPFYNPPKMITKNIGTAIEDIFYNKTINIYYSRYPAVNELTWIFNTDTGAWLSFNTQHGFMSGTPSNDDVGTYWVDVEIIDLFDNSDSYNYSLSVENLNDPPIINSAVLDNATEDVQYNFKVNATDIDPTDDILNWTMETNAGWLMINSSSGNLTGAPTNDDVGTYWVNIIVYDGNNGNDTTNFTLPVINVNDLPEITTTDVTSATEDVFYSIDYNGIDIDPTIDALTFTWHLTSDADWLDIDSSTGILSGTPSNDDVNTFWVNISVDDGHGGIDFSNFSLTVSNVNDPPEITTTDVTIATEDTLYDIGYEALDIDPSNDILTWSLATDADWLSVNGTSGNLTGTPTNDDVWAYWVKVTVSDGKGGSDSSNFTLKVINVNDPPVITTDDVESATGGEFYLVDYDATDIDPTDDTLTWSLTTDAGDWLSLNTASGLLSGMPTATDDGVYSVNVSVADGMGGSDWHAFDLTVIGEANQPPVITTEDILWAGVNELYSVDYDATDDRTEVNLLSWSLDTNANWLSINESSGILSGTPTETDIGQYWVNISVGDGDGGFARKNFTLTVSTETPNNAPKVSNGDISPKTGDTNTEFTFTVTYTDEDNDPGEVYVWIDGTKHKMTPDPDDTDYTDGVDYTYTTKLGEGDHSYYFTATDGTDDALPGDTTTPSDSSSASSTSPIEKSDAKEEDEVDLTPYLALIIILVIIIIILVLLLAMAKKGTRGYEEPSEDEAWDEGDEEESAADEEMDEEMEDDEEWEDEDEIEDEEDEDWDEEDEDEADWDEE